MSAPAANSASSAADQSYLGALASWGGSLLQYASDSINSFLGWEDLEVIDPNSDHVEKGAEAHADEGLYTQERKQVWGTKQFQQYIGADISSLASVPVFIMEPTTVLQKAAEIMEYTELLDQADQAEDQFERMAYVVAYVVSPFGANERAWKPFNPVLGETYELEIGNNVRYLAEQVSHHPPVTAAHAENEHFEYDLVSAPTTKFLGNSLDIYPYGRTRIRLHKSGEVFTLVPPNVKANNLVIGRTWLDCYGELYLGNSTTGSKCILEFQPCGWFGYGRYEFSGHVTDKAGVKHIFISGKWNSHLDMVPCNTEGEPLPDVEPKRLWTCAAKPEKDYYSFTKFVHKMNSCEGITTPMSSDSRRRSDRAALERGEMLMAGNEKHKIEEMQRAEKREREKRAEPWAARWFTPVAQPELLEGELDLEKVPFWQWNGQYSKLAKKPTGKADEIHGKGFSPWQYPDMHKKDEEETA